MLINKPIIHKFFKDFLNYREKISLLVVRQKGESQNRINKKTKHVAFSEKTDIYEMFFLRKIWRALFSCYLHFEIRLSASLLTSFSCRTLTLTEKLLETIKSFIFVSYKARISEEFDSR